MKRTIGTLCILVAAFAQADCKPYDWVLIYYMPYDNDLSVVAKQITGQFLSSRVGDHARITLQVDLPGAGGVTRYVIGPQKDSIHLDEERSASAKTFSSYLLWVAKNFKATHYGIVLLSHGGGINEYGVDLFPQREWMPIDSVALAIRDFNREAGIDKLDLFFEQVCMRGSVENLFEFRDVAKYTMASQDLVPAPNYYYPKVFSKLGVGGSAISARDLADLIVASDRDDMYYSYVLIDNTKWEGWLTKLADFSHEQSKKNLKVDFHPESMRPLPYGGEMYFDFASFIGVMASPDDPSRALLQYTATDLIHKFYPNPKSERARGYSGLSLLSPFKPRECPLALFSDKRYKEFMQLCRQGR
jgi:hypothetical protein